MASANRTRWSCCLRPLALALVLAGCSDSKPRQPLTTQPAREPAPLATTPANALRLFEWCWERRDLDGYGELLTENFLFVCAASDSAGNAFQGRALTRVDEIESVRHLFTGGSASPPANSVSLHLDRNLIPQPDTRAGKEGEALHQEIITSVVLRIETDEEDFQVTGAARFFLVRGDVALIPAELVARGFRPDTARWFIERWEDETLGSAAAWDAVRVGRGTRSLRAQPARNTTLCAIKTLYR